MRITPIEIRKQEFKRSMRGYDADEVDTFLDIVAKEYENLINENEQLDKQVATLEAELKHFKDVEKTLKHTLYNVQQTSQLSKENSQKEASLIRKEAELAAAQMLEKAKGELQKMKDEVASLRRQKESFVARLRHLLSSQLELIEVLAVDDEKAGELKRKATGDAKSTKVDTAPSQTVKPAAVKPNPQARPSRDKDSMPVKNTKTNEKKQDFFKDIFGDNMDVDEILK